MSSDGPGSPRQLTLRAQRSDGEEIHLQCTFVDFQWEGGPATLAYCSDVTAHMRADVALQESEAEKRAILDGLSSSVAFLDRELRVLWANQAALDAAGMTEEQIAGRKCYNLWLGTDRACVRCPAVRAFRERSTQEDTIRTPDGRVLFERAEPVFDETGRLLGVVEMTEDITQRHRADEAAEEHAQFLDALLLALPLPVYYKDTQGRFLGCNSAFEDFTGKYSEDMTGKTTRETFPEHMAGVFDTLDAEMMRHPSAQVYEAELEDSRGRPRQVIFSKATFSQADGTVAGLVGSWTDITEQKEAEESARRSENDLAITLDSIGDAVIATDVDGCITRINPVAAELTGWDQEEAVGRPLEEVFRIIDAESRSAVRNPVSHVLAARTRHTPARQTILMSRTGRERQISESGAPIMDAEGVMAGVVVVFRDITEQRLMEEHFQQSQKMESIGRLAGGIAHDFNNLLGGIMGFTELMRDHVEADPELTNYVQTIMNTSERAAELTSKLLTFSRKGMNRKVAIPANDVIRDVEQLLSRTLDKRVEIRLSLAESVPPVLGDRSLLQNALLNLGVNAGDAMPKGGSLTFSTAAVELDQAFCKEHAGQIDPGTYVEISVADTGTGIDRETLRHIFEPFFTTKAVGKGTGLGLAMVYGTVRDHGGIVTVESRLGRGTVFHLYLPEQAEPVEEERPAAPEENVPGQGTILLADDESVIRDMASEMLRRMGYEIILAENGEEAVDIYRRNHSEIDLVILDMMMPKMNGREAFAAMRGVRPDVRAIISSGFSFGTEEQDLLNEGFMCLVQKPYRLAQLSAKVAESLKRKPAWG